MLMIHSNAYFVFLCSLAIAGITMLYDFVAIQRAKGTFATQKMIPGVRLKQKVY